MTLFGYAGGLSRDVGKAICLARDNGVDDSIAQLKLYENLINVNW